MKNIPIITDLAAMRPGDRYLVRLNRLERNDYHNSVTHIFNPYNEMNWLWGGGYWCANGVDQFNEVPATWAYVFDFSDGTNGVCMVRDVNPALAALHARVNLEPEI